MSDTGGRDGPTTRPATDADDRFLRDLFAATRPEFDHLPADVASGLLAHQYEIRAAQYAARFPDARDTIIEIGGRPIGRLLVAESEPPGERGVTVVVDIAIHPDAQGRGHGTAVLEALLAEADRRGDVVELSVARDNPAIRLYERLGFRPSARGHDNVYCLLTRV